MKKNEPLSKHYLVEFYSCCSKALNDAPQLEKMMTQAVSNSGATIIKPFFHTFSPHGVSGIIVIAESHFSIHTWPEHNFASIDFFSCSPVKIEATIAYIKEHLHAEQVTTALVERGFIHSPSKELAITPL